MPDNIGKAQLTGLGGSEPNRRHVSIDRLGKITTVAITLNRVAKEVLTTVDSNAITDRFTGYDAYTLSRNGLAYETVVFDGATTTWEYDGLRRLSQTNGPRPSMWTKTVYEPGTGRVDLLQEAVPTTIDPIGYVVKDYTYDAAGRVNLVTLPLNGTIRYEYDNRDRLIHTWGSAAQPMSMVYSDYDQRTGLTTYRGGSGWDTATDWSGVTTGTADTTTWIYHPATGLLETKRYASGASSDVTYTYTTDGLLDTRTWARGIVTTYGRLAETGELETVTYSNEPVGQETEPLKFYRDRLGRMWKVEQGPLGTPTMTHTFTDADGDLLFETEAITGGIYAKTITRTPDSYGRLQNLVIGSEYAASYGYDPDTGRIETVSGPGLPNEGVTYQYHSYGRLQDATYKQSGASVMKTSWSYATQGDVVSQRSATWYNSGGTPSQISMFAYEFDARWQRTQKQRSGVAYASSFYEDFAYNDRQELTGSDYFLGAGTLQPQRSRVWDYDNAGNRESDGDALDPTSTYYCTNALNQYDTLDSTAVCPPSSPDVSLSYDADGNLTNKGGLTLLYDSENRLLEAYPTIPVPGDRKLVFTYDYRGRRVETIEYIQGPPGFGWMSTPYTHIKFVWDGWRVLAELNGQSSNAMLRTYTWGLDVSETFDWAGGIGRAGGIGGLLAVNDTTSAGGAQDYIFAYDAQGNVTQVIDWDAATVGDALVANYEYDAYGNLFTSSGTYATKNRWRMSTKQFDAQTGFGYWGYRFYAPGLGRWLNRDPIGEIGGANLYSYLHGLSPLRYLDALGLQTVPTAEEEKLPEQIRMTRDRYWEKWKADNPGLTKEQYDWAEEELNRGCVGITCMNLGKTRPTKGNPPDLRRCFDTRPNAEREQENMMKSCYCQKQKDHAGDSQPRLFSIHYWAIGRDGEGRQFKPSGRKKDEGHVPSIKYWWRRKDKDKARDEGFANFDFGWVDPDTDRIWHADQYHKPEKGVEMTVYNSSAEKWAESYRDFSGEVWCVACDKGPYKDSKGGAPGSITPE